MNRSEQIANRAQPDGQATNLSNLQINERRLDADYEIRKHNLARSEMGLLKVFDLVPRTAGKANFEARLDDGNPGKRREPELDCNRGKTPGGQGCALRSLTRSGRRGTSVSAAPSLAPR